MRFTPNANEYGHIVVKPPHHNFIKYINPLCIKLFSHVKVPCLFHFTHVEEPIIIFNILLICITQRSKDSLKTFPWNITIKSERCTSRHCRILCWPPVPPVHNYDPATHVEITFHLPNKLSKVYWIFHNLIRFRYEYLFQILNRK